MDSFRLFTEDAAATLLVVLAFIAFVFYSHPVQAQNLYIGGSYGQTTMTKTACPKEAFTCEPRVVGWKAVLGYRVNRYLSLEAQWVDLGRANRYALPTAPADGPGRNTVAQKGLHSYATARGPVVEALGFLPISNRVGFYAGLGVQALKVRNTVDFRTNQAELDAEGIMPRYTEGTSLGPVWTLGAQVDLTKRLAVRAEFNHYHRVGGSTIGGITEKDLAVVGAIYTFR